MTTDAARWDRIKAIFQQTFDLDPAGRVTVLDAECGDDREIRASVERSWRRMVARIGFSTSPTLSSVMTRTRSASHKALISLTRRLPHASARIA